VRHLIFHPGIRARLQVGEEQVDLGVAHLDLVVHLALAQPVEQHLLAQVLAPGLVGHAVALERAAEFGQAHVVVLRHALHRAVELHLVDAQPGVASRAAAAPCR
jgi:hypothetical protein